MLIIPKTPAMKPANTVILMGTSNPRHCDKNRLKRSPLPQKELDRPWRLAYPILKLERSQSLTC